MASVPKKSLRSIESLLYVLKELRSSSGCPWDREQTHKSLKKYLMEECAELMDSIDEEDVQGICEELGDVLMHIVFHAQIGAENKDFDFGDVVESITKKMIRRHPHVFSNRKAENSSEVVKMWEEIKKEEKKGKPKNKVSLLDGTPRHLPALFRAHEIQKKAAKVGFDWDSPSQIVDKIEEELSELKSALASNDESAVNEEIGDLLFAVVNLSRFRKGENAEELLAKTIQKFQKRFRYIEGKLAEKGKLPEESSLEEMDLLWNESKKS